MRNIISGHRPGRIIVLAMLILMTAAFISCGKANVTVNTDGDEGRNVSAAGADGNSAIMAENAGNDGTVPPTAAIEQKKDNDRENGGTVPDIKRSIVFSASGGFYPEEFDLELSIPEGDRDKSSHGRGRIFYTLDGSDPAGSDTAVEYTSAFHIYIQGSTVKDGNVVPRDGITVSGVDPLLFSGNYNTVAKSGYFFESTVSAPQEDNVDRCTIVRAVIRYDDGTLSDESGAAFFIGSIGEHIAGIEESCAAAGHQLAVVSIAMDYDDLFDSEKGIYVKGRIFDDSLHEFLLANGRLKDGETARALDANYKQHGREWERKASVTMFEADENGSVEVISQVCGIRIQGNYSRSDLQKGFRLYARGEYGKKNFRYPVFGTDYTNCEGQVMDKFDTLVLRAGGNCAFTAKFNDVYWQSLLGNTECETQMNRACVVYLNGEYWGLYVLQEDYSDDHFEDKYGVDKDSVVIYKGDAEKYACGYKLDEGNLPEGESEDYYFRELFAFFESHNDLAASSDYEEFCRIVDEESVLDYFAAESWINNKWDWPGKNWSMWRAEPAGEYDGRWRFMFYDMEFGGVSGSSDAKTNTIKEDNYKPEGLLDRNTENPAVLCFAWLMTNKDFKERFCKRLEGLSESCFNKDAALKRLDLYEGIYSPLYDRFFLRYPGSGSAENAVDGGYASIRCIRDFLKSREDNIGRLVDYINKKR